MTGANAANIAVAVGLIALAIAIYRARPRTRVTVMPAELTPAEDESRWGTDSALHEACALIWDLPEADPDAGFDRIQQAINDDTEGN
ncbi:hypothetical protein [Streptomyces sp. NPDC127038]|uniref:hypothetical protein n=1 Tax=Streptomyces sp. NPDC127038 TaxID=3347114 RepID=UPI0036572716